MNGFGSWAYGNKWYEQLRIVDDMNELGLDLKTLDAMNILGLLMTWSNLGRELSVVDTMNNSVP